jgi:protein MpaA
MKAIASLFLVLTAWGSASEAAAEVNRCADSFPKSNYLRDESVARVCAISKQIPECLSTDGEPIFHFDKGDSSLKGKKILVFGQIHGDEGEAGVLAALWAERLLNISPRNSWRVIAKLNPDGSKLGTRTNKNKVDINRNFPTKDWTELALKEWEAKTGKNPRRFPGHVAGSEPETKCAIKHIEDFKPDVIVSIHTPYGLLDYDGPKSNRIKFSDLPWQSLGTFPGSLGRYMWTERNVPVLTIELRTDSLKRNIAAFKQLQDQISFLTADDPKAAKK